VRLGVSTLGSDCVLRAACCVLRAASRFSRCSSGSRRGRRRALQPAGQLAALGSRVDRFRHICEGPAMETGADGPSGVIRRAPVFASAAVLRSGCPLRALPIRPGLGGVSVVRWEHTTLAPPTTTRQADQPPRPPPTRAMMTCTRRCVPYIPPPSRRSAMMTCTRRRVPYIPPTRTTTVRVSIQISPVEVLPTSFESTLMDAPPHERVHPPSLDHPSGQGPTEGKGDATAALADFSL